MTKNDRIILIVVVFATYLLHELWTLWPRSDAEFAFFPLNKGQVITRQSYIFLACGYAIWVIFMAVIYRLFDSARDIMFWFVVFQFAELVEYFLTYNKALFHVKILNFPVGINITNIKVVVMFVLVTSKIVQWKISGNSGR